MDLRTVQLLLGHTSIRTTVRYIQLTRKTIDATQSPLDLLDFPMMYPFIQGRIVHDPTGIARHYQARIQEYFETHPRLTAAWAEQLRDLRQSRLRSDEELAFPQWSDFARHIEDAFADEIAEPSVPGDA